MKKIKVAKKSRKLTWIGLIIGGLLLSFLAYRYVYQSLVAPSTVAVIQSGTTGCVSKLKTFVATGACGGGLVEKIEYTCTDPGREGKEGGSGACVDSVQALRNAEQYCGQSCPPPVVAPADPGLTKPTPVATVIPTPTPQTKQSYWGCVSTCRKTNSYASCVRSCRSRR